MYETYLEALLSFQFAASHCASPGSTPPVKSTLSASSLLALTQSPLLCQGQTPPSRRKCVRGNHLCCTEGLSSSRLGMLCTCLQINENKSILCEGLVFAQKICACSSHFCVQCLHLACFQETWYELGSLEGGEVAMKSSLVRSAAYCSCCFQLVFGFLESPVNFSKPWL